MAKWQRFERLAEQILSELSPQADVQWNQKLKGKLSGTWRQIDVLIRAEIEDREALTIVEAKNTARRATIEEIDKFASVLRDIEATKGIMVCKGGFSNSALQYGRKIGISLYNIHDAETHDWNLEISLPIVWIDLTPKVRFQFQAYFEDGDTITADNRGLFNLSTDKGQTPVSALAAFESAWNEGTIQRTVGPTHHILPPVYVNPAEILVRDQNGKEVWRAVNFYELVYTVSRRAWLGYFTPSECRGTVDYLEEAFVASHLPLGEIPIERDEKWTYIDNLEKLAISLKGTVVTTEGWQVETDTGEFTAWDVLRLD